MNKRKMGDKSLRDDIKQVHNYLQKREKLDSAYLSKELKALRHQILFVHMRVE